MMKTYDVRVHETKTAVNATTEKVEVVGIPLNLDYSTQCTGTSAASVAAAVRMRIVLDKTGGMNGETSVNTIAEALAEVDSTFKVTAREVEAFDTCAAPAAPVYTGRAGTITI